MIQPSVEITRIESDISIYFKLIKNLLFLRLIEIIDWLTIFTMDNKCLGNEFYYFNDITLEMTLVFPKQWVQLFDYFEK